MTPDEIQAYVRAAEARRGGRLCENCAERAATCIAKYDDMERWEFGCDGCCGHGCEDGRCYPLDVKQTEIEAALQSEREGMRAANEHYAEKMAEAQAEVKRLHGICDTYWRYYDGALTRNAELEAEVERLRSSVTAEDYEALQADRDEWREQHERLLHIYENQVALWAQGREQLAAERAKVAALEAEIERLRGRVSLSFTDAQLDRILEAHRCVQNAIAAERLAHLGTVLAAVGHIDHARRCSVQVACDVHKRAKCLEPTE